MTLRERAMKEVWRAERKKRKAAARALREVIGQHVSWRRLREIAVEVYDHGSPTGAACRALMVDIDEYSLLVEDWGCGWNVWAAPRGAEKPARSVSGAWLEGWGLWRHIQNLEDLAKCVTDDGKVTA